MLQLTPEGERAIERAFNLLSPRGAVLSMLYEIKAGVEIEDIVKQTGMAEDKAATIVRSLINDGMVREV
jgi:DNA-binding IclR family transcriptional regulator